tara:strand:- start:257 stop:1633 length:1377 start_codon:yes stop_codon:yes gene_type:complete
MAQAKGYDIKEFALQVGQDIKPSEDLSNLKFSGDTAFDLRGLVSAFNYYESVDSPTTRMEIVVYDTVDMINNLNGNEFVRLVMTTDTDPDVELSITQKVFKIGEVTKSERAVTYILYTTSPGMQYNESNKVFQSFMDKPGHEIVRSIEKKYLKKAVKKDRWEDARGNFNFISPSWRPYDVIAYVQDKIVGGTSGSPGYLYFETYRGSNFVTMDYLCSASNKTFSKPVTYTYEQANVGTSEAGSQNAFKIENLNYPDRANHLEKFRTGAYSNVIIGISMSSMTSGFLPSDGATSEGKKDSSPAGSINPPVAMGAKTVWGLSKHLNRGFPFFKVDSEYFSDKNPSRVKIRALPSMKNAQGTANPDGNAANMSFDTVKSAAYSQSRWQLLNAIKLDITVPGNVALCAGDVVNVRIPASGSASGRVELDEMYSGKYLILGVKHSYHPTGVTTKLNLSKDSIL